MSRHRLPMLLLCDLGERGTCILERVAYTLWNAKRLPSSLAMQPGRLWIESADAPGTIPEVS